MELAADAGDRRLKSITRLTGAGPSADIVDLAHWAAWRWAGRTSAFLRTASPLRVARETTASRDSALVSEGGKRIVVRVPPASNLLDLVVSAASRGPSLVLAPSARWAREMASGLAASGIAVALMPDDWGRAAAGGCTVVGTRSAAWAPAPDLASVVVLDEHDEGYAEERAPTWNARDVAIERAHRAGAPCVLTSPCPSLEALAWGGLRTPSRTDEREGWPIVEVVDRRRDDPRLGLYSERLAALLRSDRRVVCVLNRKGRARLLTCAACGEPARCEHCGSAMAQDDAGLVCGRCGMRRPVICAPCGSTRLRAIRLGVSRVRDELERLSGSPVQEVSSDVAAKPINDFRVVVGTEAVLHRVEKADVVAFLDFDQEMLAPRYRAAEAALALLARAARLTGGRGSGGRLLVQTRLPRHEVIDAALLADPSRVAEQEASRREALRLPPSAALALIAGACAPAFVDGLRSMQDVEVLGPAEERFLVRAPDHRALCDALAAVPRPVGRLRVEVDPVRA
jgi:primosomal protein N' (replication factor Y)